MLFSQSVSHVRLFVTLGTTAHLVVCWWSPGEGFSVLHHLLRMLKLMSIESVMPSNHLILCHPLLLLPSIFPSIGVFSQELALCIRWPKYWSFSYSISPSNEYSGLISFRKKKIEGNWLVWSPCSPRDSQESFPTTQFQNIDLWYSAFLLVQLSHPYMTTGKTIALTIWNFVDKVMSLLFNTLSGFVTAFLPRSKHLLISWLQSLSAVILEPKKIKSVTVSIVSPSICHDVMGPDAMIFVFEYWVLSQLFYSLLSTSSRDSSSSSLSAVRVVSTAYLWLLIFLPAILIPAVLRPAQHFTWCTLHIFK